jgi:hypothetical protein
VSRKKQWQCLITLLFICLVSSAQQLNLQQQVRLSKHEWPLDELLQQVTRQTGVRFSINTRKFPSTRKLYVKILSQPVNALLAEIRKTTGIVYTQVGTHIIMLDQLPVKRASASTPLKSSSVQPKNSTPKPAGSAPGTVALNTSFKDANLQPTVIIPRVDQTINIIGPASTIPVSSTGNAQVQRLLNKNKPATIVPAAAASTNQRGSRHKNEIEKYTGWFSKTGASTDDVLYLHSSIMAGHTYAYAIIGYTSNFKHNGFRYGIGGSLPLKKRWDLHLQLSTGKLGFQYDSDSVFKKEIDTRWHQMALKLEWKISKKIRLQFGPVYNLLKSTTSFNNTSDPFSLTPQELEMLGNHIHPIYTIKDEIGPRAATLTKSWIGLQAGIYFNLDFSPPR